MRWKLGALVLPFLFCTVGLRLGVRSMGDAIARDVAAALPKPSHAPAPTPLNEDTDPSVSDAEGEEPVMALPHRIAARGPAPHRRETSVAAESASELAVGKDVDGDGGRPPSDAPRATFVVAAAVVAKAMARRDVGAVNAVVPDGTALGAKLVGVSKYRTGLRDGDIVVSVAGTRTPNVETMVGAAMGAASRGGDRLAGRVVRGDATFAVVLELPK